MAVYTHISAEDMSAFLTRYDHGHLVNFKGIAEGVENSNYMVETTDGRYILTIYEKRVNVDDLPFFMDLLDHLADRYCPVPRTIKGRAGAAYSRAKWQNRLPHRISGRNIIEQAQ